jgi:hypothetical protein
VKACYAKGGWWYENDWRGQKDQLPTLEQVSTTIKQAITETIPKQSNMKLKQVTNEYGEICFTPEEA